VYEAKEAEGKKKWVGVVLKATISVPCEISNTLTEVSTTFFCYFKEIGA
jgi:hypothetical protein